MENDRQGKCDKHKIWKTESTETCFQLSRTDVRADLKVRVSATRDQFPRNFIIANVTRKSLTCYEDVVRVGRVTSIGVVTGRGENGGSCLPNCLQTGS